MTGLIMAAVLVAALALMVGSGLAHRTGLRARQELAILERLGNVDASAAPEMLSSRPQRLAASPRMQRLLKDLPTVAATAEMLEQSGLPTTVLGLFGRIVAFAVAGVIGTSLAGVQPAGALIFGLLTAVVPVFLVTRARYLRSIAFEAQLPQALELIALYLRSGRSLPQAFLGATDELLPPAGEEFAAAAEEYRLGRPLDVSLRRLAQKYPLSIGFRLFSVAVSVLGQTGGNMVEVLERIKRSLGASTAYAMRLKALTGESRTSAWILGVLPGIFLGGAAMLSPEYFNAFFDTGAGRVLLGFFFSLWSAGVIWIRRLMGSGMH